MWFGGRTRLALALTASLFAGCTRNATPDANTYDAVAKSLSIEDRIGALENRTTALEQAGFAEKNVTLTPDDHGFASAMTDVGPVLFKLVDVTPYADGSRLSLKVGNPSLATIVKLQGTIGSNAGKPAISKPMTIVGLLPGSWSTQTIDIPGIPPAQLHWVTISDLSVAELKLPTAD